MAIDHVTARRRGASKDVKPRAELAPNLVAEQTPAKLVARSRTVLEFDAATLAAIERLREETGARTTVAVVKSALRLYDFLSAKRVEGWNINLVRGNEAKELVVL